MERGHLGSKRSAKTPEPIQDERLLYYHLVDQGPKLKHLLGTPLPAKSDPGKKVPPANSFPRNKNVPRQKVSPAKSFPRQADKNVFSVDLGASIRFN